jgi:hypothetical protein
MVMSLETRHRGQERDGDTDCDAERRAATEIVHTIWVCPSLEQLLNGSIISLFSRDYECLREDRMLDTHVEESLYHPILHPLRSDKQLLLYNTAVPIHESPHLPVVHQQARTGGMPDAARRPEYLLHEGRRQRWPLTLNLEAFFQFLLVIACRARLDHRRMLYRIHDMRRVISARFGEGGNGCVGVWERRRKARREGGREGGREGPVFKSKYGPQTSEHVSYLVTRYRV